MDSSNTKCLQQHSNSDGGTQLIQCSQHTLPSQYRVLGRNLMRFEHVRVMYVKLIHVKHVYKTEQCTSRMILQLATISSKELFMKRNVDEQWSFHPAREQQRKQQDSAVYLPGVYYALGQCRHRVREITRQYNSIYGIYVNNNSFLLSCCHTTVLCLPT